MVNLRRFAGNLVVSWTLIALASGAIVWVLLSPHSALSRWAAALVPGWVGPPLVSWDVARVGIAAVAAFLTLRALTRRHVKEQRATPPPQLDREAGNRLARPASYRSASKVRARR